jgi:DNA-binding MarR family transcriptional regulator
MHMLDKAERTPRDVIFLYTVMTHPGSNGKEIANMMGIEDRSSVQSNIDRLMRHGLMEDRRTEIKRTIPNRLYVTPAGVEFWNTFKA